MHPGQIKPNEFELTILESIARKEPSMRRAFGKLRVISREFTGVGCFTNFAFEETTNDLPERQIGLDEMITMPGVPGGMGAVLFCRGGSPRCLEIYSYGDDLWEGVYDGFTVG